ncbi:MAG: hypothetical protein KFH87_02310, partial [Bacteroidetes bacterium]|nr:hypothetical protein [Bacteroidota bacterium]
LIGSKEAVDLVQRSSTHFFQRPDADHITYDPQRTALTGVTAGFRFEKISGGHWLWGFGGQTESPGFNINDAGILTAVDDIDTWSMLTFRENLPGPLFHNYKATVSVSSGWNYGFVRQYATTGISLQATWKNFYRSALSIDYGSGSLNDHLTRGGPLMRSRDGWNLYGSVSNSYSEDLRWSTWFSYFHDALGSQSWSTGAGSSLRTQGRIEFSVEPTYTQNVNVRQYVTTTTEGPPATYGKRYVFATIDQTTLSARFRFSYAFSPDLTLELYAEPFAASGAYSGYGTLAAAASEHLRLYGKDADSNIDYNEETGIYSLSDEYGTFTIPNPDFNILSFRSNIVLRWEWIRGSTLYLVWQQNRATYEIDGASIGPRDLFRSFDSPGDNFLALKISYWIPVT